MNTCPKCGEHQHTSECNDVHRKSMQGLAKDALYCLDACNLSGVVHSYSRVLTQLRELAPDQGTEFYNTHPVAVLYATKIAELTRVAPIADMEVFSVAYRWCKQLAETGWEG